MKLPIKKRIRVHTPEPDGAAQLVLVDRLDHRQREEVVIVISAVGTVINTRVQGSAIEIINIDRPDLQIFDIFESEMIQNWYLVVIRKSDFLVSALVKVFLFGTFSITDLQALSSPSPKKYPMPALLTRP